jgi:hypothetical protein
MNYIVSIVLVVGSISYLVYTFVVKNKSLSKSDKKLNVAKIIQ